MPTGMYSTGKQQGDCTCINAQTRVHTPRVGAGEARCKSWVTLTGIDTPLIAQAKETLYDVFLKKKYLYKHDYKTK